MNRRVFIQNTALITAMVAATPSLSFSAPDFPVVRVPVGERKFKSEAVEAVIRAVKAGTGNKELGWLFENCFPNTLDTTVDFELVNGQPDTYVWVVMATRSGPTG